MMACPHLIRNWIGTPIEQGLKQNVDLNFQTFSRISQKMPFCENSREIMQSFGKDKKRESKWKESALAYFIGTTEETLK